MTIKNKLTFTIVLVFMIVIAILGYFYLSTMNSSLRIKAYEETTEKASESAHVIAQLLDVRLGTVKSLADLVAETETVRGFESKIPNLEYSLYMFGFDYYAIQWHQSWYHIKNTSFSYKRPVIEYPGLTNRALFGRLYGNEADGLLLMQTIYDKDGQEIGRFIAKMPAYRLWGDIKSTDTLASANLIVSKSHGEVLYPSSYSGGLLSRSEPGIINDVQVSLDRQTVKGQGITIPIANAQMNVTVLVNNDEINREYNSILFVFFIVVGASLLLIGVFVFFISSHMTRSISALTNYVAQMGADCGSIPDSFTKRTDEAGKLANSFSLLLTRLNAAMDEAEYTARHDSLTLLKNRYCLENDISEQIKTQQSFAFALLDVDDFKVINDSKGHDEGDRLLKDLASVFRTFHAHELIAYRWGGDEFALIIYGSNAEEYESILKQVMERIADFFKDAGDNRITVSIGVCVFPDSAETYKDLLINADKALAWAKMSGKVNYCIYNK